MQVGGIVINMAPPHGAEPRGAEGTCRTGGDGRGAGAAGLHSTDALAEELAEELSGHARHVELAERERTELEAAGQPVYELPLVIEGIDLAALHRLAAELRDQGAA